MVATTPRPARTLVIGCGGVAQCTLPLLVRDAGFPASSITVIDFVDNRDRVSDLIAQGMNYVLDRVRPDNLHSLMSHYVGDGDLLLDLAWNIDTPTIVNWCHDHGVKYLNTSTELWNPNDNLASQHPTQRTLYARHQSLTHLISSWGSNNGPAAVVEHGANPGLVSHFTKRALVEISTRILAEDRGGSRTLALEDALANNEYNVMAQLSGTKVIHISERDTQLSATPKRVNEFVNTWSVDGFYEEGIAPAELGWGTHEKQLPKNAYKHCGDGPQNQICIAEPGMSTWVRSWVPCGDIRGMVIRHGEAYTISNFLTVRDHIGRTTYRPTVHYAYCPADAAVMSVHELQMRDWNMQPTQRVMNDDILDGGDELGVLLLGHDFTGWWTGSLLDIHETRNILPGQNATTMQVAGSILAAVEWMIENPNGGLRVPDELPWDYILDKAAPYLGPIHSAPVDWDPLRNRADIFDAWSDSADHLDHSDPWQFANFRA